MDGVIFDLDGTLWDSRENVCISWNSVLSRRCPSAEPISIEMLSGQMGKLLEDIGKSLFGWLPDDERIALTAECCEYENEYVAEHGGVLYEGLEEILKALSKRYRLFVVSNCQSGYIEAFFAAHGLEGYFADYECNGRTGLNKAENIKLIVQRNSLKSPVYVGDTALDESSAREAGVPFIWAAYGFGAASEGCASVGSFGELPELCEKLESDGLFLRILDVFDAATAELVDNVLFDSEIEPEYSAQTAAEYIGWYIEAMGRLGGSLEFSDISGWFDAHCYRREDYERFSRRLSLEKTDIE